MADLTISSEVVKGDEIISGTLICPMCEQHFPIVDGIVVFGMRGAARDERQQEMNGEVKWIPNANEIEDHVAFAETSSVAVEEIIRKLAKRVGGIRAGKRPLVLDVGADSGLPSWLFTEHGYEVVAVDLSIEFLAA